MRVVFFGNGAFGLPVLRRLATSPHKVMAVITNPDKPRGRGHRLTPTPVGEEAQRLGLPLWKVDSPKDPTLPERLRELEAQAFVVVAYRLLPRAVWSLPPLGTLNIHPSLLPAYRGPAPIPWTIIRGEKTTGLTIFQIRDGVDTGEIVLQRAFPLPEEWDAGELERFLSEIGAQMLLEALEGLSLGRLQPRPQPEVPEAPYAPKLSAANTHIQWTHPAEAVYNFIRGLSPHPRAWALLQGKHLHILRAQKLPHRRLTHPPGILWQEENFPVVACQDAPLRLLTVQLEGRKPISGPEFVRGYVRNQLLLLE